MALASRQTWRAASRGVCAVIGKRGLSTAQSGGPLPERADVVVIGGGIVGASAAWHLARLGKNVIVLEQNMLTSGSTWHAAGLVGQVKGHEAMTRMSKFSRDLYSDTVDANTGLSSIGWSQTGSLALACSPDMWTQFLRATQLLKDFDIPHVLYGPTLNHDNVMGWQHAAVRPLEEASAIHPLLDFEAEGVVGALHTPTDGIVNPSDACMHVVGLARAQGVRFVERCGVSDLVTDKLADGTVQVTGVSTVNGEHVACNDVLLACGQWTKQLAATVGVSVPTAIVPHQYAVFDHLPGKKSNTSGLPVVRHYEAKIYVKPEVGGLMVGMFEGPHAEMPPEVEARNAGEVLVPNTAENELYEGTMDKMHDGLLSAMSLVPDLGEVGIKTFVHGPDTHSVDHEPILGRAPFTENLWVATGFNSLGITMGPGVGVALADWIVHGDPARSLDADFTELDVRRFHPEYTQSHAWCTARALEGYATEYGVRYPMEQFGTEAVSRGVRLSPVHTCTSAHGAVYGSVHGSGWERPLHYPRQTPQLVRSDTNFFTEEQLSFDRRETSWWQAVEAEHRAAREGVAVFDMSSFGKLMITGEDAEAAVEWCMSSPITGVSDGKVIYTQMLNERAGVEADLTVLPQPREAAHVPRSFYVVTAGATCTRDADHIMRAARQQGLQNVHVAEVSDEWAVLAVMGPQARLLLERVITTPDGVAPLDLSNKAFPFGSSQTVCTPGVHGIRMLRVSFVGELGWELHVPATGAVTVWEQLRSAAPPGDAVFNKGEGLVVGGYRALLSSLRVEKRFVHFGHDVTPLDTPIEAGLGFVSAAKLKQGTPFLGREALAAHKSSGARRRLVSFTVADEAISIWGREGIYRNGERVGHITSGGFGYTVNLGRAIGMGYVNMPEVMAEAACETAPKIKQFVMEGTYELEVAGRRVPATVHWEPLYDPRSERMRDTPGANSDPLQPLADDMQSVPLGAYMDENTQQSPPVVRQ